MQVLIADLDIYDTFGGGQTFYRGLFDKHPEIDFTYLSSIEAAGAVRPRNVHALPYHEIFNEFVSSQVVDSEQQHGLLQYVVASNVAASVAGRRFDVVEIPDYRGFGPFLLPALRRFGVQVDRMVLSLHGRLSKALRLNQDWFVGHADVDALATFEDSQYRIADTRYGISRRYLREWQQESALSASYLSPLWFLDKPTPRLTESTGSGPIINFVGRFEKWKGPDLFINLIWWLPRSNYRLAQLVGYQKTGAGLVWASHLREASANRQLDVQILPALGRVELEQIFRQESITVLPSRWDTLNIVALESVLSGCPTVISEQAGASDFLRECYPNVPFVALNPGRIDAAVPELRAICLNYADYRGKLVEALAKSRPTPGGPSLAEIYSSLPVYDSELRARFDQKYQKATQTYEAVMRQPTARVRGLAQEHLPRALIRWWRTNRGRYAYQAKAFGRNLTVGALGVRPLAVRRAVRTWTSHVGNGRMHQPRTPDPQPVPMEIELSQSYQHLTHFKVGQAEIWRRLAQLEQRRGNHMAAAAYLLRFARLVGQVAPAQLQQISELLSSQGYLAEARVAEALYGARPESQRAADGRALLEDARQRNLANPLRSYELVDDLRGTDDYRVAVIVSIYNAADKLPLFLETISQQTLFETRSVELILIDSGSPSNEYELFRRWAEGTRLSVVYARSQQRETIQSAWNRGIAMSRAPYLAFLGVDEMLLPNCLAVLAQVLDRDQSVDWVQANTVVTTVDQHGAYLGDVMAYNRDRYQQDLVYLETCYLSWVGALYRRSIHERFGYYDPSFQAAGDTEFKNRVLPFVKTKYVPSSLGYFLNYPEERTTGHPRAEIEDLRAWYLHRSLGGVQYAFGKREPETIENCLQMALSYRKSYCRHWSSDIEYAHNLALYLSLRRPDSRFLRHAASIDYLLRAYRRLDQVANFSPDAVMAEWLRAHAIARMITLAHRVMAPRLVARYQVINDNRYEQHTTIW